MLYVIRHTDATISILKVSSDLENNVVIYIAHRQHIAYTFYYYVTNERNSVHQSFLNDEISHSAELIIMFVYLFR